MPGFSVSRAPSSFGEGYLARRQRLAGVVRGVLDLAAQTGVEVVPVAGAESLDERLAEPFLFVVFGEVNSGKSSLFNAMFGQEICPAGALPRVGQIQRYGFGETERDELLEPSLCGCFRSAGFLRHFNLIDTPGTNGGLKGHERTAGQFLPAADLIVFVFPVSNPWGASTWDLISQVPAGLLDRVVFVIQQSDQREAGDLKVIGEHVRDLAQKRMGRVPRVFAVSAQRALAAKRAKPVDVGEWAGSGMMALEEHICTVVCESARREGVLKEVRDETAALLRRIEDRIEDQVRLGEDHGAFLRQLEAEVDHEREKHTRGFARKAGGLGDVFAAQGAETSRFLGRRLGVLRSFASLLVRDTASGEMEKHLIEGVKGGMEERARTDAAALMEVCRQHWAALQPRVRARMGIEIPPFEASLDGLGKTRDEFVQRLGMASRQPVLHLKLRSTLESHLQRRRAVLSRLTSLALAFVTAAGVAGYLGAVWIPWAVLAAGAIVMLAGALQAWSSRRTILREFADHLSGARHRFGEMLDEDYQNGVREFFLEYATMFQAVRRRIADAKQQLEPRTQRWTELFLALKALDQEL
jgi:predicted GTPase